MFVRRFKDCKEFVAGDGSLLWELLHADKGNFKFTYSLAEARVSPGKVTKRHRLKTCEVYYILQGKGLMHINEESQEVEPGCAVYIPPNSTQFIENIGDCDLVFLCIVQPAWRKEDEEILE